MLRFSHNYKKPQNIRDFLMYNFPPLLRCFDDYIRGKYIYIYIFPRNVRHPAKSMLQNLAPKLGSKTYQAKAGNTTGNMALQPTPSIQNPVPLRKRYHRGTQRAEGRGCGKDFPGSRAVASWRAGACVQACACPLSRPCLALSLVVCARCVCGVRGITMRPLGYGLGGQIGRGCGRMWAGWV